MIRARYKFVPTRKLKKESLRKGGIEKNEKKKEKLKVGEQVG